MRPKYKLSDVRPSLDIDNWDFCGHFDLDKDDQWDAWDAIHGSDIWINKGRSLFMRIFKDYDGDLRRRTYGVERLMYIDGDPEIKAFYNMIFDNVLDDPSISPNARAS